MPHRIRLTGPNATFIEAHPISAHFAPGDLHHRLQCATLATLSIVAMVRCFKFVALALMLVMGTLPLLASASPACRAMAGPVSAAPAAHRCCPEMAAMAEAA